MATTKSSKKTAPSVVTINRTWQLVFIGAMVLSQLAMVAALLWSFFRYSHMGGGPWAYQIVQLLYPILFVAAGYVFVRARVRGLLPQLFWAFFVGTIGLVVYYGLQLPLNFVYAAFHWYSSGGGKQSWWAGFGWIWTQMAAAFVLYSGALWAIAWRGKHR